MTVTLFIQAFATLAGAAALAILIRTWLDYSPFRGNQPKDK